MKFFLLRDDINFKQRWYLGSIKYVNNWFFIEPPVEFMEPCTYEIEIYREGKTMDFTNIESSGAPPVVSKKFVDSVKGFKEISKPYCGTVFQPLKFSDHEFLDQQFYVMVTETTLDAVNERDSEYTVFDKSHSIRPDLAGRYDVFTCLIIDPEKAANTHIFRLKKKPNVLIVSEIFKKALQENDISGAIFEPVNGEKNVIA